MWFVSAFPLVNVEHLGVGGVYPLFSVSRFNCCSPNTFIISLLLVNARRVLGRVQFGAVQKSSFSVGCTVPDSEMWFLFPFPRK